MFQAYSPPENLQVHFRICYISSVTLKNIYLGANYTKATTYNKKFGAIFDISRSAIICVAAVGQLIKDCISYKGLG